MVSGCGLKDIALLIDTSTSVMPVWSISGGIQDFIRRFIGTLNIGDNAVRLSVQPFADIGYVNWNLNVYYDKNLMADQVQYIYFRGNDQTFYHAALNKTYTEQFILSNGDRTNIQNVVLILTDGSQNYDIAGTQSLSRALRAAGAIVYVIGWGTVDRQAMIEITGGYSDRVYTTSSYQNLLGDFNTIYNMVCAQTGQVPTPAPFTPAPFTPAPFTPAPFTPAPFPTLAPGPGMLNTCSSIPAVVAPIVPN